VDRFDDLVSEYLDGTLGAEGRAELESLIDADPARRDAFVELVREHRILSVELKPASSEAFTRRLMADLDKDRTRFVRAVMDDLKPPTSGGTRPGPRPRRTFRPRGEGSPGWVLWASLAAGLLVILAIVLSFSGGEDSVKPERRFAKEKPKAVKVEPAPAPLPEAPKEVVVTPLPKSEAPVAPRPEPKTPDPLVTPSPLPAPKPTPEVVPPTPKPAPEKAPVTIAEVAKLESVEGDVSPAPGPLTAGFVVETRTEKSGAVIRYPDGTRVDLGGMTRIQDEPGKPGRVLTMAGVVTAEVAKQPADKPMLFLTATAEARVVGTTLRVETIGEATRLDVTEGLVRLTRLKDKASVEVKAGHYAIAASSGSITSRLVRVSAGLVALYTFKEGKGTTVRDVSRVGVPLDLRIETEASVKWTSKALVIGAPGMIASPGPATKVAQACRASNELTIEAWIRPGTLTPANKDGRIVALSGDFQNQDFLLGQDELKGPTRAYFTRLRTTSTDLVGKPALEASDNTVALKLSHVVYTRTVTGVATLYVDGVDVARASGTGSLSNWNESYRLALGNEFGSDRAWLGELHLVSLYSRAMTADDVKQNFKAGAE